MAKNKLLIISLDAVSNDDLSILAECPTFRYLSEGGTFVSDVKPVFLSNTYPIHTSIVTGCPPSKHGIFDNTLPAPGVAKPDWHWYARDIKVPTLYQKASLNNLDTAGIFWPVTAKAKIRYNMPEILPTKFWENQIILSLTNGSPLLQLSSILKYGKKLKGSSQPMLDDFACSVLCDLIKHKQPDLMMLHLTDVDSHKHLYGANSTQAVAAIKRMDSRLSDLLSSLVSSGSRENCHIIVLSDHGMTDVEKSINPNKYLEEIGLINYHHNGTVSSWKAWVKCCGGSGFLYLHNPNDDLTLSLVKALIEKLAADKNSGIKGILNDEEFRQSGFDSEACFGIEPLEGVEFVEHPQNAHHANHGYSLHGNAYNTFYLINGPEIKNGLNLSGGSLLDIAPLAAALLDIPIWEMDGQLRTEFFAEKEKYDEGHDKN